MLKRKSLVISFAVSLLLIILGSLNGITISTSDQLPRYSRALQILESHGTQLGFENGDLGNGWQWGPQEYDKEPWPIKDCKIARLDDTKEPKIEGKQSLKVTVCPFDYASNGARSEVVRGVIQQEPYQFGGGELFYAGGGLVSLVFLIPYELHYSSYI